jgi:hypothetical protein
MRFFRGGRGRDDEKKKSSGRLGQPSLPGEEGVSFLDRVLEKGYLPDFVIRAGINHLLSRKLKDENRGGVEAQQKALMDFVRELKSMPIAGGQ